ncbi:MAG TPA: dihydrofolate reductase family protein [Candidatus Dormibacteraeota bacterium]|nr:dihydrofolate reductase family protein [Candidatus Dormibacteraeota bacterium]
MLTPFEVLFETDLPEYPLPEELKRLYGRLGFAERVVYSNFVSSLDGVVTLGSGISAGSVISGKHPADRFLMALLRACADAVVVGAGTMRATPGHIWTPAHVFPDLAPAFAALRASLGRPSQPRLVLLTITGDVDFDHPALRNGATVLTTRKGAERISDGLPPACDVVVLGRGKKLDIKTAFDELARRRFDVVLTEGGPNLMGQLIKAELLDEMFLTLSPVIAGRDKEKRLGMVHGVEFLPSTPVRSRLLSVRRQSDLLFLRYGLKPS